jgi:hypothetical protein
MTVWESTLTPSPTFITIGRCGGVAQRHGEAEGAGGAILEQKAFLYGGPMRGDNVAREIIAWTACRLCDVFIGRPGTAEGQNGVG